MEAGVSELLIQPRKNTLKTLDEVNEKQRVFCEKYLACRNGTEAVIHAGYSAKCASVTANKLLNTPCVKKYLERRQYELSKEWSNKIYEVIEHLYYLATRDGKDFVDDAGRIVTDVRQLPRSATVCIDGIDQTVDTWFDREGNKHETVTTKLHLAPKNPALKMALEHKGLIAPAQVEVTNKLVLDVEALYKQSDEPDEIEQKLLEVTGKRIK